MTQNQTKKFSSGATLVEVVITVGLLVTMLLPLVGMLSVGVETSGKAINDSVSSRIASQLIGEVQQANWSTINRWQGKEVHFNDQGVQLKANEIANSSSYIARVTLDDSGVNKSTTGSAPPVMHEIKVLVLVSSLGGEIGKKRLDEAVQAINNNRPLPASVRVSRTIVVNFEKQLAGSL